MTTLERMKLKDQAQARAMTVMSTASADKLLESTHYVDGYAANYERYVLWEDEDGPVYERFEKGCFANTDMSDVIMQFDHAGRVYARTSNKTLVVFADDTGLRMGADLSLTEAARQLHEDIDKKLITKMSWRFTPGEYYYDEAERTIVHRSVKKIWDVSAVSIPANQSTEINARSFVDGVIAEAARREAELCERRRKVALKIKCQL